MNRQRKTILAIVLIILLGILAGATFYIASRVSQEQAIAPTAPVSEPAASCTDQCPRSDGTLVTCTTATFQGTQSLCNSTFTGRVEPCGGQQYCCNGTSWSTNMSACPSASPTATVTTTPTGVAECGACGTAGRACSAGLTCDYTDGRCKKNDGSSVCWVGGAACTVTATSLCVPSDVVTCTPDCPTACGNPAGVINTCTNSCDVDTTKACPATIACEEDIEVAKTAYANESSNTAGNYELETEIDVVSKNQTFVYSIYIENLGEVDAANVTINDNLDGENQDELTYVDAETGCTFSASNRRVTCTGITVEAGERVVYSFRVRVSDSAVNGDVIENTAIVTFNENEYEAIKDLTISTIVACDHTCTTDAECSSNLVCDVGKCRNEACVEEADCVCPVAVTEAPAREATATRAPARVATEAPARVATQAPLAAEPTVLPEAGILDFPGIAAFGGGLLLAVIGILLAL